MSGVAGMPAGGLCAMTLLTDGQCIVGDPTEGIVAARRFDPASPGTGNAQAGYDPLNRTSQYMATLHSTRSADLHKGSTEAILKRRSEAQYRGTVPGLRWSGKMQWQSRVTHLCLQS